MVSLFGHKHEHRALLQIFCQKRLRRLTCYNQFHSLKPVNPGFLKSVMRIARASAGFRKDSKVLSRFKDAKDGNKKVNLRLDFDTRLLCKLEITPYSNRCYQINCDYVIKRPNFANQLVDSQKWPSS